MPSRSDRFQVDLRGIIQLLGQHLYSSPDVFVRELLQNAVDAHLARRTLDPAHRGWVRIELTRAPGVFANLLVEDDGVGLTAEEMHQFLATIGVSSKRVCWQERRGDFLGQFGIGLLSCFMVSDEIVVVSQSARPNTEPVEWRGHAEGTYSVRRLRRKLSPGTRVYLQPRDGSEDSFEFDRIVHLARRYGEMLPFEITVVEKDATARVDQECPPWHLCHEANTERERARYCHKVFGYPPLDTIRLKDAAGGVEGLGFILPRPAAAGSRNSHRIYSRGMFVTERSTGLLPEWAFFLQCVVNADLLTLTASREDFVEDHLLERASEGISRTIRDHLAKMARHSPDRFAELLSIHDSALRALAIDDDDFFRTVIDILPFETSLGPVTLGEYRRENLVLRVAPTAEQFRQISTLAAAQSICVFNGGYTHETELLHKAATFFPELEWQAISAADLVLDFDELSEEQQTEMFEFLNAADRVLEGFECRAEIRRFQPSTVPALYASDLSAVLYRSMQRSKDLADSHWGGILSDLQSSRPAPVVELCFNYGSPLVRQVAHLSDAELQEHAVKLLYVQALLLGQHPLARRELDVLSSSLGSLLHVAVGKTVEDGE